ncbi:MAG: sporulation protein YabP [Firmicutes bacterium]|nr:sporulation protein YabP [Bacillota bacterium]
MDNKLTLVNRKILNLTGIEKVVGISDSELLVEVDGVALSVQGSNMEVKKLDVESGILEIEGLINNIKYFDKKQKLNFIKRIFK